MHVLRSTRGWPPEGQRGILEGRMARLSTVEVRTLLQSLGFAATAEDLDEITHRLNAFTTALEPLAGLDLEDAAPPAAALDLDPDPS